MVELTIEEKAKLYDKKLSDAKHILGDLSVSEDDKYFIRNLFPELVESEDERIRKELLDFCKNRAEKYFNDPKYKNISSWIAWLEKQGECHISHDDEIMIKQLTEYFTTGHGLQNTNETIVTWLNDVKEKFEKLGEQKSVYEAICTTTKKWSKEDNDMMKAIIEDIHMGADFNADVMREANEREAWFKSLKCRYISLINRCNWKPSGEQLKGIECAIKTLQHQLNIGDKRLNSLYEDLKKLMEE